MRHSNSRRAQLAVLFMLACTMPHCQLWAAENEQSLFELVSSDVGLCVELTRLGDEVPKFIASEAFQRVRQAQFYQKWVDSPGFQNILGLRNVIEKITQKPIGELASELFGESIVLAIYPNNDGDASAIFLTQTRTDSSLNSAVALWNQNESVEVAALEHDGRRYFRRTESKGSGKPPEVQFYTTIGRTFAVSDREGMIRRTITQAKRSANGGPASTSILASSVYRRARKNIHESAVASAFFNPRAWDNAVAAGSLNDPGLTQMWPRFESATASITLERGIIIDAVIHYRGDDLPETWRQFLKRTAGAADFIKYVPQRAIAAFAGRYDPNVIEELITQEMSEREKKQFTSFRRVSQGLLLGHDLFTDVLAWFEPNWGAYIVPRRELIAGAVPLDGLIAFQIPETASEKEPADKSLRLALDNGLTTGLNFLAAIYNGRSTNEPAVVQTDQTESGTIRWMDSYNAYRPAYCLTNHYLVLSSSPDLITEFLNESEPNSLGSAQQFQDESTRFFANENQVLFVNLSGARRFLSDNRQFFVNQAVQSHSVPHAAASEKIMRLEELSQLFDSAFVAARVESQQIRIVAGAVVRRDTSKPTR